MRTCLILANFTDQGIRNVKDSMKRADAFSEVIATGRRADQIAAQRRRSSWLLRPLFDHAKRSIRL